VKKVFDDLRVEQSEWTGVYMDNHVKEAMEWSKTTQQVAVVNLSPAEKAAWNAQLQPLTAKWITEAKTKGLAAEQIISDLQALIKKYSQ